MSLLQSQQSLTNRHSPLQGRIARYSFSIAAVLGAFALKLWLIPLTGRGAPYVIFFAAVTISSLVAGVGPGICAVLLVIPLGAEVFVLRAGYPVSAAVIQSLLFGIDGFVVVYLTFLMRQSRDAAQEATFQQQLLRQQAESANERLRIAQVEDIRERERTEEALRQAVTAREKVLNIVAHDLRNPLSSILQSVALAQRRAEPERLQKRLEIISHAATRMEHLIQDLLELSLIETGQLKIEPERLATADLVREVVEIETPLASSSGLDIRVDVAGDGDVVWASRDQLHEVFGNLISNATKFTAAGGHITVGALSRQHDVLFWVADTGCGIPAERLPHLFDRFWAAVPIAGRLGPGLGLAIAKEIVEAHGGRIWVESAEGQGSTFFFTIPRHPRNAHDHVEAG